MGTKIIGKVLSARISEMKGFQFGTILIETKNNERYELKYDKNSRGNIPSVKDVVTVYYEGESIRTIIWIGSGPPPISVGEAKKLEADEQYEEALLAYEKLVRLDPNYASAWYNKAKLHHKLNQVDQLKICHLRLEELKPHSSMKHEIGLLLGIDTSPKFVPTGPPQQGDKKGDIREEKRNLISSNLEEVTRNIFGDIFDFNSQIVCLKESHAVVFFSEPKNWSVGGRGPSLVGLLIRNLGPIISTVSDMMKKDEYTGSVWIHQKFKRRNVKDSQDESTSYSVLYQGILLKANTVIFPNVIFSAILNHSVPRGVTFLSLGSSTEKAVFYFATPINEQENASKMKEEAQELGDLRDAKLLTLFLDQSGYDAGIMALKIAKTTKTEIMDLLTSIPSYSFYRTQKESRSTEYTALGVPILSIVPWKGKTIISLQMSPYAQKGQSSHSIIQKIQEGTDEQIFEIGLPNSDILSSALLCIEKLRTMNDFPRSDIPRTEQFVLWSHALIGLEIVRQAYFPESESLVLNEILTYSPRVSRIVHKLNQEHSASFNLDKFKPVRGLYK